jgi:pantetheine-phosphate adenylyltransferase
MSDAPRLAILPGTFDPITNGHLDVIVRATRLFDRVIVAVLVNPDKSPLFSLDDRLTMIREATTRVPRVEVESFDGLLAEYVRRRGATAIVRGLRTSAEFSGEWPVAMMNRRLNAECETVFVVPAVEHLCVSSRLVREIASLGGPIDGLVPPPAAARLAERFAAARRS